MLSIAENIERVAEMDLSRDRQRQIAALLEECFPQTFDGRSYYKQLPHARLLLERDGHLIGHLALDHRVIRVGDVVTKIMGVLDVCVRSADRHQGIASELLRHAERTAHGAEADHLLLFADRTELYLSAGYHLVEPAVVKWLAIDERASHSLLTRDHTGVLMAKSVSGQTFPDGEIDLLGYLF